jgi:hypothetical protein
VIDRGDHHLQALIAEGPTPLALIARAASGGSPEQQLRISVQFLGEAAVALGAALAFARLRESGRPLRRNLTEVLVGILRKGPAFGTWMALLRESRTCTGPSDLEELREATIPAAIGERLVERILPWLGPEGPFGSAGERIRPMLQDVRRGNLVAYLDLMVASRNRLFGHGPAVLPVDFAAAVGPDLLEATCAAARSQVLLGGGWLGQVEPRPESNTGIGWLRMAGLEPHPAAIEWGLEGATLGALYFVPEAPGVALDLFPLVAAGGRRAGRPGFGVFQRALTAGGGPRAVQEVEYLDYLGSTFKSSVTAPATRDLLELLESIDRAEREAAAARAAAEREEQRRKECVSLVEQAALVVSRVEAEAPGHETAWLYQQLSAAEAMLERANGLDPGHAAAHLALYSVRRFIAASAIRGGDLNLASLYVGALKVMNVGPGETRDLEAETERAWERSDPRRARTIRWGSALGLTLPLAAVTNYAALAVAVDGRGFPFLLGACAANAVVGTAVAFAMLRCRLADERGLYRSQLANYLAVTLAFATLNVLGFLMAIALQGLISKSKSLQLVWLQVHDGKTRHLKETT